LAVTYLGTLKHNSVCVWTLVAKVLFTGRERGGKSEIHSKKILIRSWPPTNITPVTATLHRVNTAFVSTEVLAALLEMKRKENKQTGFQTVQHSKKISIHEVHMYMIG